MCILYFYKFQFKGITLVDTRNPSSPPSCITFKGKKTISVIKLLAIRRTLPQTKNALYLRWIEYQLSAKELATFSWNFSFVLVNCL